MLMGPATWGCRQMLALSEGAILKHLQTAVFTQSSDNRMLTHRTISRQLIELWTADNVAAEELLNNIFPAGLMVCLDAKEAPPEDVRSLRQPPAPAHMPRGN
jgi:DnaJ homolog subfamily C member 13